jgi:predicted acylesterase/phospholipase RssA
VKVALVLSGGGAKAIAHAGAWAALREAGAEIVHIVGTSFGAVIGAALAAGRTPEQVIRVAQSLNNNDVAALDFIAIVKGVFATSILKARALERTIARFVPARRFGELTIPLTVTTTDLDSGELVLFGARGKDAPLQAVLYAACALPLYFRAGTIDGRRLADGGLRAVLPLSVAASIAADLVVAVNVGSGFDETLPPATASSRSLPPLIRAHGEVTRIMMAAQTEEAIKDWPSTAPRLVVVRAVAEREATFALGQADRYFRAGYEKTRQMLDSSNGT